MKIKSLRQKLDDNFENMYFFENVTFYYFSNTSKLIPIYNIFFYYFYVIENDIYINDFEFEKVFAYFTDGIHKDTLVKSDIFEYNNFETLNVENGIIIKQGYTNAGHSFGNITYSIYNILNNKNINLDNYYIIIPSELSNNTFLQSIIFLFFDRQKIIVLKEKQRLCLKNSYVIRDYSAKDVKSIDFLLNKLKLNINFNNNFNNNYDNIILIKSDITQNTSLGAFNLDYNNYFIEKNFKLIIPENYDVVQLFNIIYNAKNIIMSWGCCSYLNSVFVNEVSNILIIANIKYSDEYSKVNKTNPSGICNSGWFPDKANKKLFLGDIPNNLDVLTIEKLNLKLFDLLN